MNRQTEIAHKRAVDLALPPAQRGRAVVAPPRDTEIACRWGPLTGMWW
jgi:hypothetical protein